ncbi:MAG: hypothetical protein JSV08_07275 [Acidobacteriota bacterium]|nr:MAG: hypothetical protein JSV08_07275 [Acidobacteriota bacterium]
MRPEKAKRLPSKLKRQSVMWLMSLRIVVVSTLFIAAFILQFLIEVPFPLLKPLIYFIGVVYGISIFYLAAFVALPRFAEHRVFAYTQLVGDAAATTWLVYLTGGAESSFSFLYHIPIIVASVLLGRRGALAVASASAIAYGGLVDLVYYGVVSPFRAAHFLHSLPMLYYYLLVNLAGFFLVALMSGYLTERLRHQDIALERASHELTSLQVLHQNVLESMGSGLMTTDSSGRIEFVNKAGLELLEQPFYSLKNLAVGECFPSFPVDVDAAPSSRIRRAEVTYRPPAGREKVLGFGVSSLKAPGGEHAGWILVFEDLTEFKAMERELRMKDRMAALGEMAAGLAHEIRNPLASIRGSAQMLQRDLNLREEEGRLFDVLVRETERLNRTIEAFLHYARGGRSTRFERVDVLALLEDTTSLLRHSGECRPEHVITVSGEGGGPFWCRGDSDRLKQVFWNLSLNALQAMPQGGPLSISACENGSEIEILFRDAGRGIPRDEISNIFLPFRSGSARGLGLGLPIAYRVVESHGGSIHVDAAEGEGTVVRVRLPRVEAKKTPAQLAGGGC